MYRESSSFIGAFKRFDCKSCAKLWSDSFIMQICVHVYMLYIISPWYRDMNWRLNITRWTNSITRRNTQARVRNGRINERHIGDKLSNAVMRNLWLICEFFCGLATRSQKYNIFFTLSKRNKYYAVQKILSILKKMTLWNWPLEKVAQHWSNG